MLYQWQHSDSQIEIFYKSRKASHPVLSSNGEDDVDRYVVLCPMYCTQVEHPSHFIRCSFVPLTQFQQQLRRDITKIMDKHKVYPRIKALVNHVQQFGNNSTFTHTKFNQHLHSLFQHAVKSNENLVGHFLCMACSITPG